MIIFAALFFHRDDDYLGNLGNDFVARLKLIEILYIILNPQGKGNTIGTHYGQHAICRIDRLHGVDHLLRIDDPDTLSFLSHRF